MSDIERTMADAIKHDASDGDWVVWITPTDAAARALRGLEAAGFEVVRAEHLREAVEALRRANVRSDYHGNPTETYGWVQVSFRPDDWRTLDALRGQ